MAKKKKKLEVTGKKPDIWTDSLVKTYSSGVIQEPPKDIKPKKNKKFIGEAYIDKVEREDYSGSGVFTGASAYGDVVNSLNTKTGDVTISVNGEIPVGDNRYETQDINLVITSANLPSQEPQPEDNAAPIETTLQEIIDNLYELDWDTQGQLETIDGEITNINESVTDINEDIVDIKEDVDNIEGAIERIDIDLNSVKEIVGDSVVNTFNLKSGDVSLVGDGQYITINQSAIPNQLVVTFSGSIDTGVLSLQGKSGVVTLGSSDTTITITPSTTENKIDLKANMSYIANYFVSTVNYLGGDIILRNTDNTITISKSSQYINFSIKSEWITNTITTPMSSLDGRVTTLESWKNTGDFVNTITSQDGTVNLTGGIVIKAGTGASVDFSSVDNTVTISATGIVPANVVNTLRNQLGTSVVKGDVIINGSSGVEVSINPDTNIINITNTGVISLKSMDATPVVLAGNIIIAADTGIAINFDVNNGKITIKNSAPAPTSIVNSIAGITGVVTVEGTSGISVSTTGSKIGISSSAVQSVQGSGGINAYITGTGLSVGYSGVNSIAVGAGLTVQTSGQTATIGLTTQVPTQFVTKITVGSTVYTNSGIILAATSPVVITATSSSTATISLSSDFTTAVSNATTNINSLTTRVGTAESNISSLNGRLVTAESDIDTNAHDIINLATTVSSNFNTLNKKITPLKYSMGVVTSVSGNVCDIAISNDGPEYMVNNAFRSLPISLPGKLYVQASVGSLAHICTFIPNNTAWETEMKYVFFNQALVPSYISIFVGYRVLNLGASNMAFNMSFRVPYASIDKIIYNQQPVSYAAAGVKCIPPVDITTYYNQFLTSLPAQVNGLKLYRAITTGPTISSGYNDVDRVAECFNFTVGSFLFFPEFTLY